MYEQIRDRSMQCYEIDQRLFYDIKPPIINMDNEKKERRLTKKKTKLGEKSTDVKSSLLTEVPDQDCGRKGTDSKKSQDQDSLDEEETQDGKLKEDSTTTKDASPKKKSAAHAKKDKEATKEWNSFNRV